MPIPGVDAVSGDPRRRDDPAPGPEDQGGRQVFFLHIRDRLIFEVYLDEVRSISAATTPRRGAGGGYSGLLSFWTYKLLIRSIRTILLALLDDALLLEKLRSDLVGVLLLDIHLGVELPHGIGVERSGDLVEDLQQLEFLLQDDDTDDV